MAEMIHVFFRRFSKENLLLLLGYTVVVFIVLLPANCIGDDDDDDIRITFMDEIVFDPMRPRNVFGNNQNAQTADEGIFSSDVSWDGTVTETGLVPGDLQKVYEKLTFRRWTNNNNSDQPWLWEVVYEEDDDDEYQSQPSFEVSIVDAYGNNGKLSHDSDHASWLNVSVRKKKVEKKNGNDKLIFRGRVRLEFDISNARRSGTYRGTICTTLTFL